MLRGDLVGLRARTDADIEIFEAELLNDVATRVRADNRPWVPVPAGGADSPYRAHRDKSDSSVGFAAVELASGELAGDALLWGVDLHHRSAHIGLSLRPAFRGRHLGTDIVRVLCRYGFAIRGLHRLSIETLADNHAMINAATKCGFLREGTLRHAAWVEGGFADEVLFGLLATEWKPQS